MLFSFAFKFIEGTNQQLVLGLVEEGVDS